MIKYTHLALIILTNCKVQIYICYKIMGDKNKSLPIKLDLPKNYLQDETKCEYHISLKMKKVWAVELDLLTEFDRVCKKYNLPYVATGGTLLGAVRHKGFIPWDDDIDLGMKREHYQKLCEVAQQEFKHPYFFQTEWSDPTSLRGHAQLRNSETTAIIDVEQNKLINQGIFIDIFPLDNVVDDQKLLQEQIQKLKALRLKARTIVTYTNYVKYKSGSSNKLKKRVKNILRISLIPFSKRLIRKSQNLYEEFEKECQKYNNIKTTYLGMLSFIPDGTKLYIEADGFDSSINYVDFEFVKIPILSYYNQLLTRQYGDWKTPSHVNTYHGKTFFDAEHPYTDYIKS